MGPAMCRFLLVLVLAGGLALPSSAQPDNGMDKQSDGQFTGLAFITDDAKWYELFDRPETPQLSGKSHFGPNEKGALALIFSNAEAKNGEVEIRCDIQAFDPEGSREIADNDVCYKGPFRGPNILIPTLLDLRFGMGPDEPNGTSGFSVTMRDVHSGREVDLEVSFTQGEKP